MTTYAIRMRSGKPGGGKGALVQTEVSGTLATGNDQTIIEIDDPMVFAQNTRDEVRYVNGGGAISGALAANPGMKQTSYVKEVAVVRRLTPRECERLQGFPDDWTLIEWNGKPAPDGRRYKAIGNSMAVPVMRWIGERIELADVGK